MDPCLCVSLQAAKMVEVVVVVELEVSVEEEVEGPS